MIGRDEPKQEVLVYNEGARAGLCIDARHKLAGPVGAEPRPLP